MWKNIIAIRRFLNYFNWKNNESIISDVSKGTEMTYNWCFKIANELVSNNILEHRKDGRCRFVKLTEKGLKLKEKIKEIDDIISN